MLRTMLGVHNNEYIFHFFVSMNECRQGQNDKAIQFIIKIIILCILSDNLAIFSIIVFVTLYIVFVGNIV